MKEVQSLALQMMQPCVHKCVCTTFTLLLERLHSPSGIYERIIPGDMCCVMEEMQANEEGTTMKNKSSSCLHETHICLSHSQYSV